MTTIERYKALFAGLRRAYGSYILDGTTTAAGKKPGKAVTQQKELADALYERHLTTDFTLGVIPIRDDATCVFAALDIDVYKGLDHRKVVVDIQRRALPLVACRSKSGGLHLYIFFSEPVPCGEVRAKMKGWATALGHPNCEIFPKQDAIQADEVGNWINLPYQGALVEGGYGSERYGYDDSGAHIAELPAWLDYAEGKRIAANDFANIQTKATGGDWKDALLPHWVEGSNHDVLNAVVRILHEHVGMSDTDIYAAIADLNTRAGVDAETMKERTAKVKAALRAANRGRPLQGIKRLVERIGRDAADAVLTALGVRDAGGDDDDRRPMIELRNGEQPAVLAAVKQQLMTHAEYLELMVYAGALTHPYIVQHPGYHGDEVDSLELNRLSPAALAAKLNEVVRFASPRRLRNGDVHHMDVDCPLSLAGVFMELPEKWTGLPRVDRIAETPVFLHTGELLSKRAYCEPAAAWINGPAGIDLPAVVDRVAADAALARLLDWLAEFSFDSDLDKAVAVSAMLTAAMRASLLTAPGILIDKPDFGAGASTLSSLIHIVLTGRLPAVISLEKGDESELRKHLDAIQLSGRSAIVLDNVVKGGTLKSMALSQVLTESKRSVRVLGVSKDPHVACTQLVVVTGVNIGVREDLVRRFLRCRLDPRCERPHERAFRRPRLLEEAQAQRVSLLVDLYTIAAAYVRNGSDVTGTRLSGYDTWMRWCRDPLLWLGMADAALSSRALESTDEGLVAYGEILGLWWQAYGETDVRVKEIATFSNDDRVTSLREALLAAIGKHDESQTNAAVGRYLRGFQGKIVEGSRLVAATSAGTAKWKLVPGDGLRTTTRQPKPSATQMPGEDRWGPAPTTF